MKKEMHQREQAYDSLPGWTWRSEDYPDGLPYPRPSKDDEAPDPLKMLRYHQAEYEAEVARCGTEHEAEVARAKLAVDDHNLRHWGRTIG